MSVAAETSRTALEIYQPLIVGLGAVVIGFLFNTWLEWWRSTRERKQSVRDFRRALTFDLEAMRNFLRGAIEMAKNAETFPTSVFIRKPIFLRSCDPRDLGRLSQKEVLGLSYILSTVEGMEGSKSPSDDIDSMFMLTLHDQKYRDTMLGILESVHDRSAEVLALLDVDGR
ncbi:hypothetical protein [Alteriqipengyuania sp.]|uniref:hypothetical protein n=1 Tax=Alteriqipengyuania sp. TaxID=2800692 RepID=UPI003516F812